MAKFKMRLKLTGLEVEIEGDRADVPLMTQGLREQIVGLIESPASVADPERKKVDNTAPLFPQVEPKSPPRARRANGSGRIATVDAISFKHDAAKYGAPSQDWTTAQKAMYTLYVVAKQTGVKEMTSSVIAATYAQHFKQFKMIRRQNVTRDLGHIKGKTVAEDTNQNPPKWLLLESGEREVEALIAASLKDRVTTKAAVGAED